MQIAVTVAVDYSLGEICIRPHGSGYTLCQNLKNVQTAFYII